MVEQATSATPVKKINLAKKEDWTLANDALIARELGFIYSPQFVAALAKYITDSVKPAKITSFLGSIAINTFKNTDPPLEKIKRNPGI